MSRLRLLSRTLGRPASGLQRIDDDIAQRGATRHEVANAKELGIASAVAINLHQARFACQRDTDDLACIGAQTRSPLQRYLGASSLDFSAIERTPAFRELAIDKERSVETVERTLLPDNGSLIDRRGMVPRDSVRRNLNWHVAVLRGHQGALVIDMEDSGSGKHVIDANPATYWSLCMHGREEDDDDHHCEEQDQLH
jgi:hypothetical protein